MPVRSRDPEVRRRVAERQVAMDAKTQQIGELRLAGLSFRSIAEGAQCSLSTAHEGWKRYRRSLVRGDVESEREVLCGRLERQYRQLGSRMAGGDPKAHSVGVQILELMATVLGLESPKQVAVDVNGRAPYTRFEFVVEPVADEEPRLEDGQRRLLEPAENPELMEVSK